MSYYLPAVRLAFEHIDNLQFQASAMYRWAREEIEAGDLEQAAFYQELAAITAAQARRDYEAAVRLNFHGV